MPSSGSSSSNSKHLRKHEWTAEQTDSLLDQIRSNPKYIQTFFPPLGHTPNISHIKKYARRLSLLVLEDTEWLVSMKERGLVRWSKGNWKIGKNWDFKQDDPVTIRLKELPNLAEHYEERLEGYMRYEDIPPGSKIAKRWRRYERCPEKKWVLTYLELKNGQGSIETPISVSSSPITTSAAIQVDQDQRIIERAPERSTDKIKLKRAGKRPSIPLDTPPDSIKRPRKSAANDTSLARSIQSDGLTRSRPRSKSTKIPRDCEIIDISSDDEIIFTCRNNPTPTPIPPKSLIIDSNSDESDNESNNEIRQISPPRITLPSPKRYIPTGSPSLELSRVRLAFQKPSDDIPTDSDSDPDVEMGISKIHVMEQHTFTSISITPNEQIFGMFTDPNLRPCEPWRRKLPIGEGGIPTPEYTSWGSGSGSGSASPVKSAMGAMDVVRPLSEEVEATMGSDSDMDQAKITNLGADQEIEMITQVGTELQARMRSESDMAQAENITLGTDKEKEMVTQVGTEVEMDEGAINDSGEVYDFVRPPTPPLPPSPSPRATSRSHSLTIGSIQGQTLEEQPSDAEQVQAAIGSSPTRPITPPLPDRPASQHLTHASPPLQPESGDMYHTQTEAERAAIALLWRTLTGGNQPTRAELETRPDAENTQAEDLAIPTPMSERSRSPSVQPERGEDTSTSLLDWIESRTGAVPREEPEAAEQVTLPSGKMKPLLDRMKTGTILPAQLPSGATAGSDAIPVPGTGSQAGLPPVIGLEEQVSTNAEPKADIPTDSTAATITKSSPPTLSESRTPPVPTYTESEHSQEPPPTTSNPTTIHQSTWRVGSSLLNLLIAQSVSISSKPLLGYLVAFTGGHFPFKAKLGDLIVALGGDVMDQGELRARSGCGVRYMIHPVGSLIKRSETGKKINGVEHVDILGFLEIIGSKIGEGRPTA